MRIGLVITVLVLSASHVFGSAQMAEWLIYQGQTNVMHSTPLDGCFSTNHPIPELWQEIRHNYRGDFGSGCWRGYVGRWSIRENNLFLDALAFPWDEPNRSVKAVVDGKTNVYDSPLPLILPGAKLPLKADWFSGVIRLPQGKPILGGINMGFATVYERDLFIKFDHGKVIAEKTVNNMENRKLYSSDADLASAEIGKITAGGGLVTEDPFLPQPEPKDQDDWHDARMIRRAGFQGIVTSGKPFVTRGILVRNRDELFGERAVLYIPETPLTMMDELPLADIPVEPKVANGSRVEICAQFKKIGQGRILHVIRIRALKDRESIHRRDYCIPNRPSETPEPLPAVSPR